MRQVAEISFVLVFLATGIQCRPLDELKSSRQLTDPGCPPPRCLYESKCYADGEEISRRSDGSGACHGLLCSHGQSVAWDDFNCGQATITTRHTTTPVPATTLGCLEDGIWYPPGFEISRESDGNGWCYGQYCDQNGQVVAWDDWNCGQMTITETPSSTPSTSPTPTTPLGCLENDVWYPPGSEMSRGTDGEGWCFGAYCTDDGHIQLWDDFNCKTSPPTTLPTTSAKGCYYEGKWHPTGIFEGTDARGCRYGAQCGLNGQVTRWEEFDCRL